VNSNFVWGGGVPHQKNTTRTATDLPTFEFMIIPANY